MFTDNEIIKLHADKKYKKTNGFIRNVHLSHTVIKSGFGGISISLSTTGTMSFSVAIISIFWLFLRYRFITKEITDCRMRIIEGLLNTSFVIAPNELLKNFIKPGNMWLEYSQEKIDVLGKACIEYIATPEHRKILSSHSCKKNDKNAMAQAFKDVHTELKRIFKLADNELWRMKIIKKATLDYPDILQDSEYADILKRIFLNNQRAGNLTSPNNSSFGGEGGSNDL